MKWRGTGSHPDAPASAHAGAAPAAHLPHHAPPALAAQPTRPAPHPHPHSGADAGHTDTTRTARSRSLFGEILDWMLAPLLLLWPLSIGVTYLIAKSIANSPFDQALEARAWALARSIAQERGEIVLRMPNATFQAQEDDPVDDTYFDVLDDHGQRVAGNATLPAPADWREPSEAGGAAPAGAIRFRDGLVDGTEVRIAYTWINVPGHPNGQALVQVAETTIKRTRLANQIIKGVIVPQFFVLPLAIFLVWFGLGRGLAPLHALQAHIRSRRPDDLSPLAASQAPPEMAPLVASFNELLARLEQNMALQQRFIAQAAHQMKTPLAGLRTQAELAQRLSAAPEVQRSLKQIATSSAQAARLVTQLLALARAESGTTASAFESIDVVVLARECLANWVEPALARSMDLGLEVLGPAADRPGAACVTGQPVMLREMLNNLIDNALRYTPAGGRVTVRVRPVPGNGWLHIEVEDTGPGIPAAERGRVIERFYRILGRPGEGSGLGLAIVKEIVETHGGALAILDHVYAQQPRRMGTRIRVTLPLQHSQPQQA